MEGFFQISVLLEGAATIIFIFSEIQLIERV